MLQITQMYHTYPLDITVFRAHILRYSLNTLSTLSLNIISYINLSINILPKAVIELQHSLCRDTSIELSLQEGILHEIN